MNRSLLLCSLPVSLIQGELTGRLPTQHSAHAWPATMPPPVITATIQATTLGSISNILAQIIDAYRKSVPLVFDTGQFMRFLLLSIMFAPQDYYWQVWLEHWFPGWYTPACPVDLIELQNHLNGPDDYRSLLDDSDSLLDDSSSTKRPDDDLDKRLDDDDDYQTRGSINKTRLHYRNTAIKWFIDCISIGAVLMPAEFLVFMGLMKHKSLAEILDSLRDDLWPIVRAGYAIWPLASIISFIYVPVEKRIVWFSFVGMIWSVYISLVAAEM